METTMIITDYFLGMVFGEVNQFIGAEDVLHVMLYNNFLNDGFSPLQVAREQTLSTPRTRIDLVVYDKNFTETFKNTTTLPLLAIEVKGGAHGITHGLHTSIDSKGYCEDMEKLEKEVKRGIESWFICVDMPKIGGRITTKLVEKVQKQCEERGISFAYFSQGEEDFYYAPYGHEPSYEPINPEIEQGRDLNINELLQKDNKEFIDLCSTLLEVNGHEANSVAAIYRFFRKSGLNVSQISLETYFSCAKTEGSSMPDRPDIVLFDKNYDGVFNLFKNGNKNISNDKHKINHLNTLIEVKGSDSVNIKNEKQRFEIYRKDVLKLSDWNKILRTVDDQREFTTCFIAIDKHQTALSKELIDELLRLNDNKVIYICSHGIYIS